MAAATCTHDGSETRLRCVTCEAPICPRCLVETKVGFKCPEHGRVVAAALPARKEDAGKEGAGKGGRARRGSGVGGFRFLPILLIMLLFPVFGFALMALFAATADATGIVGLLPLIAVGVVLVGGAVYFASKVAR